MNKFILKIIMLLTPLYSRLGVNPVQLKAILKTKLIIDNRKPFILGNQNNWKNKEANSGWVIFLLLFVFGLFMPFFLFLFKQPYVGHTIFFSSFIVMLAMSIITDFTNVLIDSKDNFIILPKPVNDKTIALSRILHIGIHITKIMLSLSAASIVYMFIAEGVASGLVFLLELFIAASFSIFFVNIFYLIILKFTTPNKFKDYISYFQIVFSIIIFGSYYMLPQLLKGNIFADFTIYDHPFLMIVPSVWIAALHEIAVQFSSVNYLDYILATAATLLPLVGLYLVVKVLAPGFNKKISGMHTSSSSDSNTSSFPATKSNFIITLSNLVSRHPLENVGFRISWLLSSRTRDFKLKVYPAFGYLPVYFVYMIFVSGGTGTFYEKWNKLSEGNMFIFLFYLSNFILSSVLQNVTRSEKYKASWIYHLSPYHEPGRIMTGMFKALVIKYYVPSYLLICVFSIVIWGPGIINDMVVAFFFSLIFGVITSLFLVKDLPFSQPPSNATQGKYLVGFLIILLQIGFGFLHDWLIGLETLIWITSAILPVIFFFTIKYYQKVTWNTFKDEDF